MEALGGRTREFVRRVSQVFLQYLLVLNVATFAVSIWDKYCAVHRLRRVPERTLLAMSFMGGTAGAKLARMISGHKRLKTGFTVSLNLITFFQLGVAAAAWSGQYGEGGLGLENFALTSQSSAESVAAQDPPRRFGPGS